MEIVSQDYVNRIVAAKKAGEFAEIINRLEPGSALRIVMQEWKKRTQIPFYFLGKFNKHRKTVSVLKHGDSYYIIKL